MGLDILFYFKDGTTTNIHLSGLVMSPYDKVLWDFYDDGGIYTGLRLEYLMFRLIQNGYLKARYSPKPYKAEFC